jgi:hypothetical protein
MMVEETLVSEVLFWKGVESWKKRKSKSRQCAEEGASASEEAIVTAHGGVESLDAVEMTDVNGENPSIALNSSDAHHPEALGDAAASRRSHDSAKTLTSVVIQTGDWRSWTSPSFRCWCPACLTASAAALVVSALIWLLSWLDCRADSSSGLPAAGRSS